MPQSPKAGAEGVVEGGQTSLTLRIWAWDNRRPQLLPGGGKHDHHTPLDPEPKRRQVEDDMGRLDAAWCVLGCALGVADTG